MLHFEIFIVKLTFYTPVLFKSVKIYLLPQINFHDLLLFLKFKNIHETIFGEINNIFIPLGYMADGWEAHINLSNVF